jgi:hypothetical protein
MIAALVGGLGAGAVLFAVLVSRLDEAVENELRLGDEDTHRISII